MVWSIGTFRLFGRFGGSIALYAFIAWMFMKEIEQTAPYAAAALAVLIISFILAVYRMRTAVIVASRGVPVDGTLYGFNAYFSGGHQGQRYNRIRRLKFSYEFAGQPYKGKSTWIPHGSNKDIPLHSTIPLVVDPMKPQRAYWVREAPDLFVTANANR